MKCENMKNMGVGCGVWVCVDRWVGGCGRLILTLSLFYIEFIILNAMQVLSFLI